MTCLKETWKLRAEEWRLKQEVGGKEL
jgi:hypothetical protein